MIPEYQVDYENDAEEWWDALREREPEIAARLDGGRAKLSPAEIARVAQLPGWDGGPEWARHPILEVDDGE